jgi:hypoxanthine phosphoribosyltransferase
MLFTDYRLSWEDFDSLAKTLVEQIRKSPVQYDAVLGIARGGLFLAGYLSYHLGIKSFFAINTKLYEDRNLVAPELLYFPDNVQWGHVLVVDDILDTGSTYALIEQLVSSTSKSHTWAVLIDKGKTKIKLNYVGLCLESSCWVHFPWNP